MHRKATSVGAALVATAGFGLAAFIPSALAARTGHDTTCTPNSQYNQGCTTTATDTTATPAGTLTATDTVTSTVTSTTTVPGPATPDVVVKPTAQVAKFLASGKVRVGTILAPGVVVTSNVDGKLVVDDHGTKLTIPAGAVVTLARDGTLFIATKSKSGATVRALFISDGAKVKKYYLRTAHGVSLGVDHSKAKILRYVTFTNGTKRDVASIYTISNPHGIISGNLKTATAKPGVTIRSRILEFTEAEAKYITANNLKTTTAAVKFTTTTGRTYSVTCVVPITERRVARVFRTKSGKPYIVIVVVPINVERRVTR